MIKRIQHLLKTINKKKLILSLLFYFYIYWKILNFSDKLIVNGEENENKENCII